LKAHRIVYHSTLGVRVIQKKKDLKKVERDARLDPRGGQREGVLPPKPDIVPPASIFVVFQVVSLSIKERAL